MVLRFVGIDPNTGGGNCPAVWVDDEKQEIVFQGWKPDEVTAERCAQDSPLPETEGIVRLPYRMAEIIRKALDDAAEGS
ncbi:hypothetical protein OIB37_14830 [Streptomyces sp. NBC_00820]|uniref:hypothetical protein n=1 Tax=Streptomyces sp. NBC_00820 TaxID=2975842 RepID=UPI002ED52D8D|nr:hypothetical protein OIB37_14830 [Streptomyces sp. NBC_00820]